MKDWFLFLYVSPLHINKTVSVVAVAISTIFIPSNDKDCYYNYLSLKKKKQEKKNDEKCLQLQHLSFLHG